MACCQNGAVVRRAVRSGSEACCQNGAVVWRVVRMAW